MISFNSIVTSSSSYDEAVTTHDALLGRDALNSHPMSAVTGLATALAGKIDDSQVLTNVPLNAVFTDTETNTSISLAANILTYVDELGASTQIDLSLYLDDTNLAYLVNGTLDGQTGIATFTRNDATSFTVDMSALLDDTNVTVEDVLTSVQTGNALSANQGRILKSLIDIINNKLSGIDDNANNYVHPATHSIAEISGLQTVLTAKVDDSQVLTNVPENALFTDTPYDDTGVAKLNVEQSFTAPQRATAVTEDASIAFNSGNNIKFSMTVDAALTIVNQTIDQSGVIVITGADHITGYPTEFDWGVQGIPDAFAVDDVATFAYYISGASGVDSIKIGVL